MHTVYTHNTNPELLTLAEAWPDPQENPALYREIATRFAEAIDAGAVLLGSVSIAERTVRNVKRDLDAIDEALATARHSFMAAVAALSDSSD